MHLDFGVLCCHGIVPSGNSSPTRTIDRNACILKHLTQRRAGCAADQTATYWTFVRSRAIFQFLQGHPPGSARDTLTIRVCIAEDHGLMLSAIIRALEQADDIDVVGSTQRGDEVMALVDEHAPDLVLLDNRMPGLDGVACVRLVKESHPDIKVVMLSASEDAGRISEALAAGAIAYIGKRINPDDLPSALRQLFEGVVHQAAPAAPAGMAAGTELTERELTMLRAVSRGLSTKMISRELWVSEKTVKFHLTNVYRKLGVHNRTGAMRYAIEHGLLTAAPQDDAVTVTA